ncbi:MAG: DUF3533 domain-containing protein, partial [Actinocrinis sp.]
MADAGGRDEDGRDVSGDETGGVIPAPPEPERRESTFAAEAVTVRAQIKDAVTPRSALLVLATLGLGIGFILSYVGGLHHPTPRDLPFDIVAPAQIQAQTVSGLS